MNMNEPQQQHIQQPMVKQIMETTSSNIEEGSNLMISLDKFKVDDDSYDDILDNGTLSELLDPETFTYEELPSNLSNVDEAENIAEALCALKQGLPQRYS